MEELPPSKGKASDIRYSSKDAQALLQRLSVILEKVSFAPSCFFFKKKTKKRKNEKTKKQKKTKNGKTGSGRAGTAVKQKHCLSVVEPSCH